MPREIPLRRWRVVYVEGGAMIFVDPRREHVVLFEGPHPDATRIREPDEWDTREEKDLHQNLQREMFE